MNLLNIEFQRYERTGKENEPLEQNGYGVKKYSSGLRDSGCHWYQHHTVLKGGIDFVVLVVGFCFSVSNLMSGYS